MSDPLETSDAALDGFPVAADTSGAAVRETLEVIASRFADEVRRGLKPSIGDYVIRYRHFEQELRECLPIVEALERWKYDKETECVRRNVPETLPFEKLGDYTIVREVGRGGTGVVYEAIEARTDRRVAVKLLPWRFLSDLPRRKERFRSEASTIARLRHWNIVPVYYFGEQEGYLYYVMQLVEGASLDRVIRRLSESEEGISADEVRPGGFAPDRACSGASPQSARTLSRTSWNGFAHIGVQVGFALAHAHAHHVLHNDIKPANLILDRTGRVVVTDFGGGRTADPGAPEVDEAPIGTLRYLAPERTTGQSDERSDVYSLGVTLYELVTLAPAFDAADRRGVTEQILNGSTRPPGVVRPEVPLPLEAIVMKAMSREPEARYPTAKALALDLMRFVNGQVVEAPLPSMLERAQRWWRGSK